MLHVAGHSLCYMEHSSYVQIRKIHDSPLFSLIYDIEV